VAFTIRQNGQYTTYQSADRVDFPPSKEQIVSRPSGLDGRTKLNLSQMCSYPVPNILLPYNIEAQIQQRSSKKSQRDLSKIESQEKDLNGNGSIARVENSSAEENARSRILSTIEQ
jgi:hypothetical protein